MNKIITGIELTLEEDKKLRVEAAKAGLSKRKMGAKIINDWLLTNYTKSFREKIEDIIVAISALELAEHIDYFNTIENIIQDCINLVGSSVKRDTFSVLDNYDYTIEKLLQEIKFINKFCEKTGLETLPVSNLERFAFELVDEFR